jgi:hypothetical protein
MNRRGNRSAPGEDGLTNPLIKAGGKDFAKLLMEMLKAVIVAVKCPEIWKRSKTILLFKGGDKKDCAN